MATSIVAIATLCSHSNEYWIQVKGVAYQVGMKLPGLTDLFCCFLIV